jgi:hypothetical protein
MYHTQGMFRSVAFDMCEELHEAGFTINNQTGQKFQLQPLGAALPLGVPPGTQFPLLPQEAAPHLGMQDAGISISPKPSQVIETLIHVAPYCTVYTLFSCLILCYLTLR